MLEIQKNSHIFFVGIGGVGMSALAIILHKKGYTVSGSDNSNSTAVENLQNLGITVYIGHKAEHINPDIDFVVYTNAVNLNNPELAKAKELNIPLIVRAEMLNFIGSLYFSIGVSGTHGKTTTTSMTSKIFLSAGLDPTLAVGGFLPEIQGAGYLGQGDTMIYEACEAFGSLNYLFPNIALVTNIDEDHLEFFKNKQEVEDLFLNYFNNHLADNSLLIWNADDETLAKVVEKSNVTKKVSVSVHAGSGDFWVENITLHHDKSEFDVFFNKECIGHFVLGVPGIYNVSNALLAIAVAKMQGIDNVSITRALSDFKNANRRFQIKHLSKEFTVVDDYAHHPKAVSLTLEAARNLAEQHKAQLVAVFQPHLYSRTHYFYKEFADSLLLADKVVITDIYGAREVNEHNISSSLIHNEMLRQKDSDSIIIESDMQKIPSLVKVLARDKNTVVITLGAGDVWKVSEQLSENNQ
ncbi:MAG: UDP-N-acetylmuramate--L-alanine ligase [Brevinema sp.]